MGRFQPPAHHREYGRWVIVGREPELARLRALVAQARHGSSASVVVRGEPGVGKSALLDVLMAETHGATVLATQGLEVEAPMAFAALHRVLRPLLRWGDNLPAPQARALRVAFGEEDGLGVEPFMVGVATLSILTAAAEESLVLCVVDDAHWLDPASADALLFCARRLGADRAVMVFATRDDTDGRFNPQGIPELVLTGLDPDAARTLLGQRSDVAPTADVAERLIIETRGNPLGLLELPSELSADQLRGSSALPTELHLTARVERVFLERSLRLPASVQSVLLLASADDTGDVTVLRGASGTLGVDDEAFEAALGSELLSVDGGSVTVRHPLVRSAIYQAASNGRRRRSHRALAETLAGIGDPDREAWHRALAAAGPDPEVVAALELAGARALRRGAYVSALAAYERAAALSADATQRATLTFAAARAAWACGHAARSQLLLAAAAAAATEPILVCDIARLHGHIEVNIGSAADAHRMFVRAAHDVHHLDPARALELAAAAAIMRTFGADSGARLAAQEVVASPTAGDQPRTLCLKRLLTAMTETAEGNWSAAVEALDLALAVGADVDDREVFWNLGNAAVQLGDDEGQQRFYAYALSRAREAGAATAVVYVLHRSCFGEFLAGSHVAVRSNAEEAIALATSIGQTSMTALPIAWLALLAATQGRDEYDILLARLEDVEARHPLGIMSDPVHDLGRWARAIHAAGAGDGFGALHHFSLIRLPVLARMATTEHIDAAVRAGRPELAQACIDGLEPFADATRRPWALATLAYGRAMVAEQGDAEALFQDALSQHARARRPLDEARTHLGYGEWLRRSQRRLDARQHLRQALETFQDLHAEPLATRANQELRASGETARRRDPSTTVKLTPTELKIAQLVTSGLSNKDVATQCWISPRTVAFHLRNVFSKAGVTSRGELAQVDLA
ncbi:AAA family ATPase [Nocardioides sp.]|uniref:helix-turn-helix transcriptional regulator n=1 Tax=Nocardioides sp. TaxID=35761 RepID=UPI0026055413|nr:AAA family ATPase [Nocardioides sp.]